ncbi:hypothetical protein BC826DRAFT_1106186 [Russula brevipes]|nr:hypothetical protein BC826DRAFT_1106186 [Russula brevipes]
MNGTGSEIDRLFAKLLPPAASPASTCSNSGVTHFTSASPCASSMPASRCSDRTVGDQRTFPAPTPPFPHHVSSEPFPSPPSAPPSTRPAFAAAHPPSDIISEPESSEPPSPTCHAAAQVIHSPQPTNSQLPQILTQDVISALLGMPPSRTSSVASSHRRYEGDVESSDDLHEADSPVNESRHRLMTNRSTRSNELGRRHTRPSLRGFASSEKLLPPIYTERSGGRTRHAVPAPRIGTSPAPRPLVPFHAESSLWPYPRAPLDDRDDIVELDFADTSALSDVDAFERRRRQNGKNGAKQSKKDIERSWDVPGDITPNVSAGSPRAILGRPSQAPTHNNNNNVVPANGLAASPTRARMLSEPINPTQHLHRRKPPNRLLEDQLRRLSLSLSRPVPDTKHANGATLARAAASAAIVDAIHAHSNGSAPPPTTDRNEFVREVLTLIHTDPSFVDRLWTEYCARA